MAQASSQDGKTGSVLVVDTCGERGSVALLRAGMLQGERTLTERTASAALLLATREVLEENSLRLPDLLGIGVVNGPGSFTGLRVGLAIVKGLCEAGSLAVAPVSRLAVLAQAGQLRHGFAVLRAGRDELYVREVRPGARASERLMSAEGFRACLAPEDDIVFAEDAVLSLLPNISRARVVELSARAAYPLVAVLLQAGGVDLASVDGNYVRNEQSIYARRPVS